MEHQCEECKVCGGGHFKWCSQDPPNRTAVALESIAKSLEKVAEDIREMHMRKIENEALGRD